MRCSLPAGVVHTPNAPVAGGTASGSTIRSPFGYSPWTIDPQFHSAVTNAPQKYLLQLSYEGGAYAPGLKTLQPGETATIDLRALRDAQVPDAWGHTIPQTVTSGQVHWSAKGHERYVMIGRAAHTDVTHGVSASYVCINCCPDNPYSSWTINDPITTTVGNWVDVFITLQDVDCYNTVLQPYAVDWYSLDWHVDNTGIATGNNNATITGVSGGQTTLYATYTADWWYKDVYEGGWFCNSEPYPVYFATPVDVSDACGDERDTIKQEYVDHSVNLTPTCEDFTQSRHSVYFSFNEINKGDFSWALIKDPLIAAASGGFGLDAWRSNYGSARVMNSGYRNPNRADWRNHAGGYR